MLDIFDAYKQPSNSSFYHVHRHHLAIWESCQPCNAKDPQRTDRHRPNCHHDEAIYLHQGEQHTPGKNVIKQSLPGLLLAQIPCHQMSKRYGTCMRNGHHQHTSDGFYRRGEWGRRDGFSPQETVGAAEPCIYPIVLPMTSHCTKPISSSSTNSKSCQTTERHGSSALEKSNSTYTLPSRYLMTPPFPSRCSSTADPLGPSLTNIW